MVRSRSWMVSWLVDYGSWLVSWSMDNRWVVGCRCWFVGWYWGMVGRGWSMVNRSRFGVSFVHWRRGMVRCRSWMVRCRSWMVRGRRRVVFRCWWMVGCWGRVVRSRRWMVGCWCIRTMRQSSRRMNMSYGFFITPIPMDRLRSSVRLTGDRGMNGAMGLVNRDTD